MNAPVTAPPTPGLTTTNRTTRRLVLMLMMVASVGYLCRVDITVVAPHLMAELHLSQPEMGRVFGAFLLGYTLFQIPSGWLAGRLSTQALFLALAFGWSVLTFTSALVGRPYCGVALGALPALLFLRFVLGIVAAPAYPAAGRAISQGYVGYVFVFWFFLYLVQVRKFELLQAAWLTTLPWILSLIVIPLGGIASDWAVKRWGSTWGRRSVPVPAMALAAGSLLLGAHTRSATLAAASLTISTALVLVTEGPYWASMTQISGPHSGTGGGVMNFGCNLGGLISPVFTPWLAARVGWEMALALAALLAIVGALLWLGITIDPAEEKLATRPEAPAQSSVSGVARKKRS